MYEANQNGRELNLTIIKQGTEVTGELSTSDDIRIDGKFFGNIETRGKLVISKQGYVEGIVKGVDILINGKAKGDFQVDNNFNLSPEGIFSGYVETRFINISETSIFDGTCVISQNRKPNQFKHNEDLLYSKRINHFEKTPGKKPDNGIATIDNQTENENDERPVTLLEEQTEEHGLVTLSANGDKETSLIIRKISQIEFIK